LTGNYKAATLANWQYGDDNIVIPPTVSDADADKAFPKVAII
jgi:hypothetical protein